MRCISLAAMCIALLFSSVAQAQMCVTKEGALVATSEEFLDRAVHFVVVKDEVAFNKLLAAKVIGTLKAGVKLEVEDYGLGNSKVRMPGEVQSIWILSDFMNCR